MKKRIIVCCDGTWNDLEMRYITNVGRLAQALLPYAGNGSGRTPQMLYYDDGVGADAGAVQRLLQGGLGWGIDNLIYEAYRAICMNYQDGDELCLFGFSRGAFTARSVAGMIERVGLVPRSRLKYLPKAMNAYRSGNRAQQKAFREKANSRAINIDLLGCWDTVGALGIPDKIPFLPLDKWSQQRYEFHDRTIGRCVERALHAVAIDEPRKEFRATPMIRSSSARASQELVEHWFPGDHGSVGGGSWEKRGLSNRCLAWMVEQAAALGVELGVDLDLLHDKAIADHGIFYMPTTSLLYSRTSRSLAGVKWHEIDRSARDRWVENPKYRPRTLSRNFSARLKKLSSRHARKTPAAKTRLEPGRGADLQVFARTRNNRSKIIVEKGERYRVEVSRLQVWKDGDLDPCDVRGWNTVAHGSDAKLPYQDGEQVDFNMLRQSVIKLGRKGKLVPSADWFELVYSVDGDDYRALNFGRPADETEPFSKAFTAPAGGELYFAANDLAADLKLVDKYDNNAGWVWIRVIRET